MNTAMSDELREIPLFAGVSDAGLDRIALAAGYVDAQPGQVLALPDDPGSGMFVILEGEVAVELRSSTVELGPGNFFGELSLLVPDASRVARVRARTKARCLSLPRDDFLALLDSEPGLALPLLRELARRLVSVTSGDA
jgi:CRP-like cAMP-binding protein